MNTAAKASQQAIAQRLVTLEMRSANPGGTGWQSVARDEALPSGTEFSVKVEAAQPAYVYLAQRSAGTEASIIYPSGGQEVRALPSQPALMPASGRWFRLDDRPGEEALLAVVSTQRCNEEVVKKLLGERGEDACVYPRDPQPPEPRTRERGGKVLGQLGDDGIAVLCLPFRHR